MNKGYRPILNSAEIEIAEKMWWQEFAEFEDRFAWTQPSVVRNIIRGHYVNKILQIAGADKEILELGCGSGWLAFDLVKGGAKRVKGIDFSLSQILLAKEYLLEKNMSDVLEFECVNAAEICRLEENFDCVVIHGFIHHLSQTEIRILLSDIKKFLRADGKLIIIEPVLEMGDGKPQLPSIWEKGLNVLHRCASVGRRLGLRRFSDEELRWREVLKRRSWGIYPHEPSPKEIPFYPGELEYYLHSEYEIQTKKVCMARSHLVMQEWLLRAVSHPLSTKPVLPVLSFLASFMDKQAIRNPHRMEGRWLFTMFVCCPVMTCV